MRPRFSRSRLIGCPLLVLLAAQGLIFPSAARAEEEGGDAFSLTQQQREEKRLLFNQYVEEEIARREREKYRARPEEKKQKTWVAKFSALYGYDSNVHLSSARRGDGFFQETLSGSFRTPRPDVSWIPWSGRLGFSGYLDFYNYENFERSSYQTTLLSVFSEEKLSQNLQLKLAYELTALRYPDSDQLTYFGHEFKPTLTVYLSKTSSLGAFVSYERRDYRDRKALDPSNLPASEGREDDYMEAGLNPKFYPDSQTYFSATVAAKQNDSNDIYRRYNDYAGWKANVLAYRKIRGPLSAALLAGCDVKQYRGLTFSTAEAGSSETQEDNLFYAGIYLYYDLNAGWQAVGSYLYKQNESNNPVQDWAGWTTNLGLNLSF